MNQPAKIRVTSVTGHVYCRDFPPRYADWYQCDPLELFGATTLKREANPENNLIRHLQREAEGATYLVLWLDNDKEGENICFEVVDIVQPLMVKKSGQQIFRAKFSSVTRRDIQTAFEGLTDGPNKNESNIIMILKV